VKRFKGKKRRKLKQEFQKKVKEWTQGRTDYDELWPPVPADDDNNNVDDDDDEGAGAGDGKQGDDESAGAGAKGKDGVGAKDARGDGDVGADDKAEDGAEGGDAVGGGGSGEGLGGQGDTWDQIMDEKGNGIVESFKALDTPARKRVLEVLAGYASPDIEQRKKKRIKIDGTGTGGFHLTLRIDNAPQLSPEAEQEFQNIVSEFMQKQKRKLEDVA